MELDIHVGLQGEQVCHPENTRVDRGCVLHLKCSNYGTPTQPQDIDLLDTVDVGSVMRPARALVDPNMSLEKVEGILDQLRSHGLPVVEGPVAAVMADVTKAEAEAEEVAVRVARPVVSEPSVAVEEDFESDEDEEDENKFEENLFGNNYHAGPDVNFDQGYQWGGGELRICYCHIL